MSEINVSDEREQLSILAGQFNEIVERTGKLAEVVMETETVESKQYKYRISDNSDDINRLKHRLEESGAVIQTIEPIQQTDYYFLSPGAHPSYLEEVLCFRSEVQFHNDGYQDDEGFAKYSLAYKTNPHRGDKQRHRRTVRQITTTNQDEAVMILSVIDEIQAGQVTLPYQVHKIRTVYEYPVAFTEFSVKLHLDEFVTRNAPDEAASSYVGSYIEFTIPEDLFEMLDVNSLKRQLGIETSQSANKPYIAMDASALGIDTVAKVETISDQSEHNKWKHCSYLPYYYSGSTGTFCLGISSRDCGQESLEDVEDEIQLVSEEIMKYGGEDGLPVRAAGGGSGSDTYEYFPHHDGLKKFPSIKDKLEDIRLYRRDWSKSKRGTKRLLFSIATLKGSGERIILVHDVLNHLAYQNEWLPAHKK